MNNMDVIARKVSPIPSIVSAFLVAFICAFPQVKLHDPIPLLMERFVKGAGWIEIVLLSLYAAWLTNLLLNAKNIQAIRQRVWMLFSIVFFTQAILGLLGVPKLLMTGELHLPIPAIILAGPIYRGEGFFMPILFMSTLILGGPIWCSWLCYLGAWDFYASKSNTTSPLVNYRLLLRFGIIITIIVIAILLRVLDIIPMYAAILGILFGIGGIVVMIAMSRRKGVMAHCTFYCPMGLLATIIGKVNPLRIRIQKGCTSCHVCTHVCKYGALTKATIQKRRPGITCTLCGDCISVCKHKQINFTFPFLSIEKTKTVFIVIVVTLHTVFLGFARL